MHKILLKLRLHGVHAATVYRSPKYK